MSPDTAFRNATRIAQQHPDVDGLLDAVSGDIAPDLDDETASIGLAQAALDARRDNLASMRKFVECLGVVTATDVSTVKAIVAGRVAAKPKAARKSKASADEQAE